MAFALPSGDLPPSQPLAIVRPFHERAPAHDPFDSRDDLSPLAGPFQDAKSTPPPASSSSPAPLMISEGVSIQANSAIGVPVKLPRGQNTLMSLRQGVSDSSPSSVSISPGAEESGMMRAEASRLVEDLQNLVEDSNVDPEFLRMKRDLVLTRINKISERSPALRVFVLKKINPFLEMLSWKERLLELHNELTKTEVELEDEEVHGKPRVRLKKRRNVLRKMIIKLSSRSEALKKYARRLLNDGEYSNEINSKIKQRERFERDGEMRKMLKWQRALKQRIREASTRNHSDLLSSNLRSIRDRMIRLINTDDPKSVLIGVTGFREERSKVIEDKESFFRDPFKTDVVKEKPVLNELGMTEDEMEAYEGEWLDEVIYAEYEGYDASLYLDDIEAKNAE